MLCAVSCPVVPVVPVLNLFLPVDCSASRSRLNIHDMDGGTAHRSLKIELGDGRVSAVNVGFLCGLFGVGLIWYDATRSFHSLVYEDLFEPL